MRGRRENCNRCQGNTMASRMNKINNAWYCKHCTGAINGQTRRRIQRDCNNTVNATGSRVCQRDPTIFQATRGWNNTKVYTNSLVIEQAIGHYRNFQRTMHETQGRLCGCCGHPKPENRQEQP